MYPDPYENYLPSSPGDLFWKQSIDPNSLIKMKLWKYTRAVYRSLPESVYKKGERYLPYLAHTFMLDRGEASKPFKGTVEYLNDLNRDFLTRP